MGLYAATCAKAGRTVQVHGRHLGGQHVHYQVSVPAAEPDTRADQSSLVAVLRERGFLVRLLAVGTGRDVTGVPVIYIAGWNLHADPRAARNDQRGRSPVILPRRYRSGGLDTQRPVLVGRRPHPRNDCGWSASVS